jgi:hypothetical protein
MKHIDFCGEIWNQQRAGLDRRKRPAHLSRDEMQICGLYTGITCLYASVFLSRYPMNVSLKNWNPYFGPFLQTAAWGWQK